MSKKKKETTISPGSRKSKEKKRIEKKLKKKARPSLENLNKKRGNTWIPQFIFLYSYLTKHTPKQFSFPFFLQSFSSTIFHLQTNIPLNNNTRNL